MFCGAAMSFAENISGNFAILYRHSLNFKYCFLGFNL